VVDARRGDVAAAIAWQAAAWPADLIVLTRRPRQALSRLVRGSVPDQVMRKADCPVLAIPPAPPTSSNVAALDARLACGDAVVASSRPLDGRHQEKGQRQKARSRR
jgi:hypothetical protein